jgi:hypothetical protein
MLIFFSLVVWFVILSYVSFYITIFKWLGEVKRHNLIFLFFIYRIWKCLKVENFYMSKSILTFQDCWQSKLTFRNKTLIIECHFYWDQSMFITNFMDHNLATIIMQKFIFYRFVWNRHRCHSSTCIVCTSMLCVLFKHKCHMPIYIV